MNTERISPDSRVFTDEDDGVFVREFQLAEEELHKILSTKSTDKESEVFSFIDEEEKERERLIV